MGNDRSLTRRGVLKRLIGAAGVLLAGGCDRLSETAWFPRVLGLGEKATYRIQRLAVPRKAMAEEFPA